MKTGLAQDTSKSAKTLAQDIARKMAREPLEVLKTARGQVGGGELPQPEIPNSNQEPNDQGESVKHQEELADKMKSSRRMEALNRELSDIQKQDKFSDLQRRIAGGEEVPVEEYQELSIEQRQVLNAQKEAVRVQKINAQMSQEKSLVEPVAKKGRQLFNFGKKTEVKRQQTHVEKIVPPSG